MERYGKFALLWCPACDVQFSDPMEEAGQAFYEQHEIYRRPETLYTSPRLLNWDQRSFLRDRPGQGGRLLDVGCGTGYFAAAARELGYRVSGLDLSRPQLELARTRFGLSDVHATTLFDYARTVPPHSFDVVTAFQVLEHVADPLAFLGDARRLLATGGHLAVGVPNWRVWRMLREPFDHLRIT
jgi:2-polyprenyl-3-methyl-5-hydroxy-6-metoxy-1,4-benzoquinol methylase